MKRQLQAFFARQRREFDLELAQQFVDAEADEFGAHRAGVEPRDVEQCAENLLDGVERGIDVLDQLHVLAAALPLEQRGHVEAGGIQRLQDVVARGGEKPGLGDIGLVGVGLGAAELGVQPGELGGAFAHAHFQRGVGALQRFGGDHARRDVGRGGDDAAVRHAVGADLDDQAAVDETLEERLAVGHVVVEPRAHQRLDRARAERALFGVVADDLLEADADRG